MCSAPLVEHMVINLHRLLDNLFRFITVKKKPHYFCLLAA